MYPKKCPGAKSKWTRAPAVPYEKNFLRNAFSFSHTLFSNQKLTNFSKLEFFLLKGHEQELNQKLLGQTYCQAKGNPLMQDTTSPSSTQWGHMGLSLPPLPLLAQLTLRVLEVIKIR